jgi:vacuolar-type H+-ATPase subunit F/Vma7
MKKPMIIDEENVRYEVTFLSEKVVIKQLDRVISYEPIAEIVIDNYAIDKIRKEIERNSLEEVDELITEISKSNKKRNNDKL